MIPISITEKLKTLFGIISSSTFFLVALIISVILLITIIISLKKFKKIGKKLFIISWIVVVVVLLVRYYEYIFQLGDSFIENIFMAIYFPNLAVFTIVLIANNTMLYTSILKRELDMIYRIIWITSAILTNFLFIIILDIVVSSKVDIYTASSVYANKSLFVLLEINMAIFTVAVILTIICLIVKKITKVNNLSNTNIKEYSTPVVTTVKVPLEENKTISTTTQPPSIPIMQKTSQPFINNQNTNINNFKAPNNNSTNININKNQGAPVTAIPASTQPILEPVSKPTIQNFSQLIVNNQSNNINNTNINNNKNNQASILDDFNFTDQTK